MSEQLLDLGRSIRGEVIGAQRSQAALDGATDVDRALQELAGKYCRGEVWGAPRP